MVLDSAHVIVYKNRNKPSAVCFKGRAGLRALIHFLLDRVRLREQGHVELRTAGTISLSSFLPLTQHVKFQKPVSRLDIWLCH